MPGKEGGKAKPLKKAKGKTVDLDEDDLAFKAKQKEDAAKLKALKSRHFFPLFFMPAPNPAIA